MIETLGLADDRVFNSGVQRGFLVDSTAWLVRQAKGVFRSAGPAGDRDEAQIDTLLDRLVVRPLPRDQELSVSYRSASPELAARVANALVEAFVDQSLELKRDADRAAHESLRLRLDHQQLEVEAAEDCAFRLFPQAPGDHQVHAMPTGAELLGATLDVTAPARGVKL